MSIATEIDRIIAAVSAAHEKVSAKGGTTAPPYTVANLETAIDTIPAGGGAGVETCTVEINDASTSSVNAIYYTQYIDGSFVVTNLSSVTLPLTLTDVVIGSILFINKNNLSAVDECTGTTQLKEYIDEFAYMTNTVYEVTG